VKACDVSSCYIRAFIPIYYVDPVFRWWCRVDVGYVANISEVPVDTPIDEMTFLPFPFQGHLFLPGTSEPRLFHIKGYFIQRAYGTLNMEVKVPSETVAARRHRPKEGSNHTLRQLTEAMSLGPYLHILSTAVLIRPTITHSSVFYSKANNQNTG
jgi:hypothetical protein